MSYSNKKQTNYSGSSPLRLSKIETLTPPAVLLKQLPLSTAIAEQIDATRQRINSLIHREELRLLVIIGPCSIHDPVAAWEYAERLNQQRIKYQSQLEIVMRTYFAKPRTVTGWKGLISDPKLDNSHQVSHGLYLARELLLRINQLGLPTATEFLDPATAPYFADLISWGAIGARTTESQLHREMASALPCAVGFKNSTDGNITVAIDAIRASRAQHLYLGPDQQGKTTIYQTQGNRDTHLILRGGAQPNYHAEDIAAACLRLQQHHLPQRLLVDLSHGNSQKHYQRQLTVATDLCQQIRSGSSAIIGIMAESFLLAGSQQISPHHQLQYGQSITDPCLGWSESEQLLQQLAATVASRT